MKMLLLMTLFSISAQGSEKPVTCQLQDFSICKDCNDRVPVSCEDNGFVGSFDLKTKPEQFQLKITNKVNGTERMLTVKNKKLQLKDLKAAAGLKNLLSQAKVKLQSNEEAHLEAVKVSAQTVLYKAQAGLDKGPALKARAPARQIASSKETPTAGGVRRALDLKKQK